MLTQSPQRAAERSDSAAPETVRLIGASLGYAESPGVLRQVDLTLPRGSFHFLTGPSGAGKTSLLKLIYLAERPTGGRLSLFGQDVTDAGRREIPHLRRRMGVVFQDFRLLDHLSVFDNAALPLRVARLRPRDYAGDVEEMLEWVGLGRRLHAATATLSGGEKQRLAIARAVINRPELILADEPTGNVDAEMAERLLGLFQSLNRLGTTVLIATHDRGLAEGSGADLLVLRNGVLSREGGDA